MSAEEQSQQSAVHDGAHKPELIKHEPPPKVSRASVLTPVLIVFVVTVILAIVGIVRRQHASTVLAKYTATVAAPPVSVQQPMLQQSAQEIVLPGIHPGANLRANNRLRKRLVPRHRFACEQGRVARGH